MNEGLIPRRYAKALYKVAITRGDADLLYGLMNRLAEAANSHHDLVTAIANPFVSIDDKRNLIATAAGKDAENATFVDFIKLLVENKRLDIIFAIARDYAVLYRQQNDIHKVTVVSAATLSDAEQQRIKSIVERNLDGAKMEYDYSVDPGLIGGFTVTIDNSRLDASVSNEFKQLRVNLLN